MSKPLCRYLLTALVPINVLGSALEPCCFSPKTGYYRDGYCRTDQYDAGRHVICAEITDEFLQFTLSRGNDLITPRPEYDFPGLKAGDRWCLCALRWKEAYEAGVAPPVVLASCHEKALEYVPLEALKAHAIPTSDTTPQNNHKQSWRLENSYTSLPEHFYTRIKPTPVHAPNLVIFNHALADSLGLSLQDTNNETLAQFFSGNNLPEGSDPIAQAYAGHQFGYFTILGDGRAHLIGEQITLEGKRYDIQLKGSGQTPYSRRGDGRAALGPMLREYLISEAMHALGISTTRSLAVVTTGEPVFRQTILQGAILTRVASSHLRVGTFEYAAFKKDLKGLKALADYAIARHYPELRDHDKPYLAFLNAVIERQAKLVAAWMHVGFIHGVMNTDNMAISGETIDYGPCAFMDQFGMDTVFSSIDENGRYAFGNQASIAKWNLSRLAQAILPLLHDDMDQATSMAEAALERFSSIFNEAWLAGMRRKLGLFGEEADDLSLVNSLLEWMQKSKADYTQTFRDLIQDNIPTDKIYQSPDFEYWYGAWKARLARNPEPLASSFNPMRENNPVIIPRNQHVEDALEAAQEGNLKPFRDLLEAVQHPFEESPTNTIYRNPPPHANPNYQTFCGT